MRKHKAVSLREHIKAIQQKGRPMQFIQQLFGAWMRHDWWGVLMLLKQLMINIIYHWAWEQQKPIVFLAFMFFCALYFGTRTVKHSVNSLIRTVFWDNLYFYPILFVVLALMMETLRWLAQHGYLVSLG